MMTAPRGSCPRSLRWTARSGAAASSSAWEGIVAGRVVNGVGHRGARPRFRRADVACHDGCDLARVMLPWDDERIP